MLALSLLAGSHGAMTPPTGSGVGGRALITETAVRFFGVDARLASHGGGMKFGNVKDNEQILAVAGSLWLAISTVMTGTEMANRRRDVILSGVLDQTTLTLDHRRLILEHDWVPMAAVNGFVSLIMALLLIMVPIHLRFRRSLIILCLLASVIPLTGAVSWLIGGIGEYGTMAELLSRQPAQTAQESSK